MILVTGGTGFVGSALIRLLLARGDSVRALARPGSDRRNLAGLDVETIEGDLLQPATLAPALKGCTGLYHVAADYRLWTRDPAAMFAANVDGSKAIIRAAAEAGVGRIVYTSSVATLGIVKDGIADEQTPVGYGDMIGVYKQSKFRAEQAVQRLIDEDGAPVVIVNPSTPIGPRDIKPTPTGRMIVEAAAGRMPAFVDTGLNIAHVDDVAAGHLLAFDKGKVGQRYILGGTDMTLARILGHIADRMGRKPPRLKIPHNAILPIAYVAEAWTRLVGGDTPFVVVDGVKMAKKKMYFSSAKAARELGYTARPATQALDDAISWFKSEGYF
ncbi:MAG: NAD-dependent epimerase/dehydratase family protein [Rhodospirillales bacterium]|nr:NAD-dependent epimerase/dehydratase family protein [Rhodospirillales bacterium]